MFDGYLTIQNILGALVGGYLLGSIPFALVAARFRGVDIFNTGSRTAGTANVFWNIGRRIGAAVFVGDVAKGSAAVLLAGLLDVPWSLALLAGGAAILGHWKSIFAGFRGGDGMATLIGVTVTLEPVLATMGGLIGLVALLVLWRSPSRSALALTASFTVMLGVSQYSQIDRDMVMGLVALAMLVIFRSAVFHRRRADAPVEQESMELVLELDQHADQTSDVGPAAPENR